MNQSPACNNIYSVSPSLPTATISCSSQSLQCSSNNNNNINKSNSNLNNSERFDSLSRTSSCRSEVSTERLHPAVIVSPHSVLHQTHCSISTAQSVGNDLSVAQFEGTNFYNSTVPYANPQQYFGTEAAAVATATSSPAVLQTPSFLPPYYGFASNLTEFNMFHMCYQPLLELASPGTESSPTEAIYGFANRLQPITSGTHPQHFGMPQAYPQARNGYMASAVPRPGSAAGKRGGRRPKECEEFDITLSEEEKDKRDKRRLRNKEAAARCRQRRIDLMGSLQNQVDLLKAENKEKDTKINQLQMLKNELLSVIREHHCVLPEALRQSLDAEVANAYVSNNTSYEVGNERPFVAHAAMAPMLNRKRPASDMVSDFRPNSEQLATQASTMTLNPNPVNIVAKPTVQIKQEPSFKTDPTLYDVNGRDHGEDGVKRPTSLIADSIASTTYNSSISSGIPITTPSNINGEYPASGGLLEGPTGLTPMQPPSITPFTGAITPISNDGHSYAAL